MKSKKVTNSDYPVFKPSFLDKGIEIFLNRVNDINRKYASQEEAETRRKWKDDIISVLRSAAGEFYKCRIHDKIKASHQDRQHWEKEWRWQLNTRLLRELADTTTFKDKKKAAGEAIVEFAKINHSSITMATNTIAKYLNKSVSKLKEVLVQEDIVDFYKEVDRSLGKHFESLTQKDFKLPKYEDEYAALKMKILKIEKEDDWSGKKRKKK